MTALQNAYSFRDLSVYLAAGTTNICLGGLKGRSQHVVHEFTQDAAELDALLRLLQAMPAPPKLLIRVMRNTALRVFPHLANANLSLVSFTCSGCKLDKDDLASVCVSLRKFAPGLHFFDASHNKFAGALQPSFGTFLKSCTNLRQLILCGNMIGVRTPTEFWTILENLRSLEILDLNSCYVSSAAAVVVALSVAKLPRFRFLQLNNNGLISNGARLCILEALQVSTSITDVWLMGTANGEVPSTSILAMLLFAWRRDPHRLTLGPSSPEYAAAEDIVRGRTAFFALAGLGAKHTTLGRRDGDHAILHRVMTMLG